MLRPLSLSLLSVGLFLSLRSGSLAQDAHMPDDCVAIATQIQTETHVRFVHTKSVDMLTTDPDSTAEVGGNSITMECSLWPLGLDPQPYSYVVTVWAEGSDPSKAFYELAGRAGMILTGEKPETLNEASRHCRQKALKSEFKVSGVLTPRATVKCQFDPDVRAPNVSIWKRAPTDAEDRVPEAP
jgi:hypothetical protein